MLERIPIGFTEEQLAWLRERSKHYSIPISELVRRIVDSRIRDWHGRDNKPITLEEQQLLELLRKLYT